jgi:hypothetical protein
LTAHLQGAHKKDEAASGDLARHGSLSSFLWRLASVGVPPYLCSLRLPTVVPALTPPESDASADERPTHNDRSQKRHAGVWQSRPFTLDQGCGCLLRNSNALRLRAVLITRRRWSLGGC